MIFSRYDHTHEQMKSFKEKTSIDIGILALLLIISTSIPYWARELQLAVKFAIYGTICLIGCFRFIVRNYRIGHIDIFLLSFFIYNSIITINSEDLIMSFGSSLVMPFCFIYIMSIKVEKTYWMAESFFWGCFIAVALSYFLFLVSPEYFSVRNIWTGFIRVNGIFGHPNSLGKAASIIFVYLICYKNKICTNKRTLFLWMGLCAFSFYIMYIANSRTPMITVLFLIPTIYYLRKMDLALPKFFFFFSIFLLIFSSIFSEELYTTISSFFNEFGGLASRSGTVDELMTLSGRVIIWKTALKKILEEPFLGYGFYSAYKVYGYTLFKGCLHAHNNFIELWFATGLIGFFMHTYVYLYLIYWNYKLLTKIENALFNLSLLILFAIVGLTETTTFTLGIYFVGFLIVYKDTRIAILNHRANLQLETASS